MRNGDEYPIAIQNIIAPREVDLGGFLVRRSLPARGIHRVGPWVFFDHMGPADFPSKRGVDVIQHPHINLATVTYLFEGELVHRDSIGSVQTITPGAINLMVAGRGIVHSERTGTELRAAGHRIHGLQLWQALPEESEEVEPSFHHYPADDLPQTSVEGANIRVMMGDAFGLRSPVKTYCPTFYAEVELPRDGSLKLPDEVEERAVYLESGSIRIEREDPKGTDDPQETELPLHGMVIFEPGAPVRLIATDNSRLVIIGGKPLGKRYMWWNFVSSQKERIERAKADWRDGRFEMVPGETEFSPLPRSDGFSEREERSSGKGR
jgi:redox-sensitive bicupin YhaK (pirin superfamily)